MFEVTREQLEKIREDQQQISLDSNITLTTAAASVTLACALVAGVNHTLFNAIFVVAALASAVASVVSGMRWHRRVKNVPSTVDRILARSIDPESGSSRGR